MIRFFKWLWALLFGPKKESKAWTEMGKPFTRPEPAKKRKPTYRSGSRPSHVREKEIRKCLAIGAQIRHNASIAKIKRNLKHGCKYFEYPNGMRILAMNKSNADRKYKIYLNGTN